MEYLSDLFYVVLKRFCRRITNSTCPNQKSLAGIYKAFYSQKWFNGNTGM